MRRYLLSALLLGLLLGSGWLAWLKPDDPVTPIDRSGQPLPDYTLEGLQLRQYDDQGMLARVLKAKRLEHVADRGTALDQPRLTIESAQGAAWQISGARGQVSADGQLLTLPDDALITRRATVTNRPLRLATRNLRYHLDKGYAETDEAVTVTSNHDRIDAVGLQAWLQDTGRIHFRSQVRGHYEP